MTMQIEKSRKSYRQLRHLALLIAASATLGCGDSSGPGANDPEAVYATLSLNYHAINLSVAAPTNTVKLVSTAKAGDGEVLTTPGAPQYSSQDTSVVDVDADGNLHAKAPGMLIGVEAKLTLGDVTHADTTWVTVTDVAPSPSIAKIVVQPADGDSARRAAATPGAWLPTYAIDAAGDTVNQDLFNGLSQFFTSSDPSVAQVVPSYGWLTLWRPGTVKFTVSGYFYGVALLDTLTYTVTDPLQVGVSILRHEPLDGSAPTPYFTPPSIVIGQGGVVTWTNNAEQPMDIKFSNPSAATEAPDATGSGDIVALPSDLPDSQETAHKASRLFATPGTYTYTDPASGAAGTIVVK